MSRFIVLGAGTPLPHTQRWGSSFLFQVKDDWLLVDCGPGSVYKMMQTNIPFPAVSHLFFTHYHSDHVADYAPFLLTRFERQVNEPDLHVYGPPPLGRMTSQILGAETGAFWDDVVARTQHPMSVAIYHRRGGTEARPTPATQINEFSAGVVGEGDGWRCIALEVDHAQPFLACYGFRFETDAGILAFSGDTNYSDNAIALGKDVDLFVINALEGVEVAGKMAAEANPKRILLAHYSHDLNQPQAQAKAEGSMRQSYLGEIIWGVDLMEIEF